MPATPESVLQDLKNNKYAPVYFLQGDEPFYIDQIADYIEANALSEAEKGFNQTVMYGKDFPMNAILTNARRFPMMAEHFVYRLIAMSTTIITMIQLLDLLREVTIVVKGDKKQTKLIRTEVKLPMQIDLELFYIKQFQGGYAKDFQGGCHFTVGDWFNLRIVVW